MVLVDGIGTVSTLCDLLYARKEEMSLHVNC